MRDNARRALHQRLDADSSHRVALPVERFIQCRKAAIADGLPDRSIVPGPARSGLSRLRGVCDIGSGSKRRVKDHRRIGAVKGLAVADAHRADGVAVVGPRKGDDPVPLRPPAVVVKPDGHLEGQFGRRRPGIGVENLAEPAVRVGSARRDCREAGRQLD